MRKKKDPYTPDFIQIPYQLVSDTALTPVDRMVYGAVYFYSKMRGERCFAGNTELAKLIFTTPNTVGNSLKKLEERGYIVRGFSDPDTRARRVEIIPTVAMSKHTRGPSGSGPAQSKTGPSVSGPGPSGDGGRSIRQWTSKNGLKTDPKKPETAENKPFLDDETPNSGPSGDGEIENSNKNNYKKKEEDMIFDPGGSGTFSSDSGIGFRTSGDGEKIDPPQTPPADYTIDGNTINEAIALFLPIVPGDFVGARTAFAKPPTRDAVANLLLRYSIADLKELIRKYDAKKADKYRPEVGTVYEFCTTKLAKIEAFVVKEGDLWAQKSISSPEHRANMDKRARDIADAARSKMLAAKEKWLREHPEEK